MIECCDSPRVWEYDGAFKCLKCKNTWGALPDGGTLRVKGSDVRKVAAINKIKNQLLY